MFLVGLAAVLIGGCPFRQLVLAGEGDADAGAAVLGMLVAGGLVQSWGLRSTIAGATSAGKLATMIGLVLVLGMALAYRGGGGAPCSIRGLVRLRHAGCSARRGLRPLSSIGAHSGFPCLRSPGTRRWCEDLVAAGERCHPPGDLAVFRLRVATGGDARIVAAGAGVRCAGALITLA
jgi:hypothetical protein